MNVYEKYGPLAVIAGASEGLGAAFALELAGYGFDLHLLARSEDKLQLLTQQLQQSYSIQVEYSIVDLKDSHAIHNWLNTHPLDKIGLFVYNAAYSCIGPFDSYKVEDHLQTLSVNCSGPVQWVHAVSKHMLAAKKGGIILMSSLTAFQGTPLITVYGASKAFNKILAEGLWGEWKDTGVDIIASCAGATRTPNYLKSKQSGKSSQFVPELEPAHVAKKTLEALGKKPVIIPGVLNRFFAWFMCNILPKKYSIKIMHNQTKQLN